MSFLEFTRVKNLVINVLRDKLNQLAKKGKFVFDSPGIWQ